MGGVSQVLWQVPKLFIIDKDFASSVVTALNVTASVILESKLDEDTQGGSRDYQFLISIRDSSSDLRPRGQRFIKQTPSPRSGFLMFHVMMVLSCSGSLSNCQPIRAESVSLILMTLIVTQRIKPRLS